MLDSTVERFQSSIEGKVYSFTDISKTVCITYECCRLLNILIEKQLHYLQSDHQTEHFYLVMIEEVLLISNMHYVPQFSRLMKSKLNYSFLNRSFNLFQ